MKLMFVSAALALACIAAPAQALVIVDATGAIAASDPHQMGRLSRSGVPADWSQNKAYPGVVNTSTSYAYDAIAIPFAANATQDIYYQISIDDPDAGTFASGYNGSYNPAAMSQHYLGDIGSSGNPFGNEGYFQVLVPAGGSLVLVLNQVTTGQFASYGYLVEAFSDVDYDDDFTPASAAPEPGTWVLMIAGVGLVGAFARRRRSGALARA